jgi:hypothetical protein
MSKRHDDRLNEVEWLARAQDALADVARATGIPFSVTPRVGSISLFCGENSNVYAMLVTGLDSKGEVERGVAPFGDPPMTAREFAAAASLAETAVYALHQNRAGGRVDPDAEIAASRLIVDVMNESDQRAKAERLFEALTTEIGMPDARLHEDELGRLSAAEPSPFKNVVLTATELSSALEFAINAVYHHGRYQRQIEQDRSTATAVDIEL